jgi:hypothetical protein
MTAAPEVTTTVAANISAKSPASMLALRHEAR